MHMTIVIIFFFHFSDFFDFFDFLSFISIFQFIFFDFIFNKSHIILYFQITSLLNIISYYYYIYYSLIKVKFTEGPYLAGTVCYTYLCSGSPSFVIYNLY